MPKISQSDTERIHRLLEETRTAFEALADAKSVFDRKQNALIGALNIVRDEVEGFDPIEDGVAEDGSIEKGGASDEQKQLVASHAQLREVARRQRIAQRMNQGS